MTRTRALETICAVVAVAAFVMSGQAHAEQVNVDRMEVSAGDTIVIDGYRTWLQGCDTPETTEAKCDAERDRGELAAARTRKLLRSGAVDVRWIRRLDRYKRGLARIYVNGRNVCATLIEEGFAIPSPGGRRIDWCTNDRARRTGAAPQ